MKYMSMKLLTKVPMEQKNQRISADLNINASVYKSQGSAQSDCVQEDSENNSENKEQKESDCHQLLLEHDRHNNDEDQQG